MGLKNMADTDKPTSSDAGGPIPFMQRLMDNPFLLLLLGVLIPTVLYTIWGVMEVASIPLINN